MALIPKKIIHSLILIITVAVLTAAYLDLTRPYYPTVHEYILGTKNAKYIGPKRYKIAGFKTNCGNRPTVLHNEFDSWGGAYPGFIIMNPSANRTLPTTVKLYIYYHECGHQVVGDNEMKADNYAIAQGIKQKWLTTKDDMNKICHFVSKIPADKVHPDGKIRCREMASFFKQRLGKATIK